MGNPTQPNLRSKPSSRAREKSYHAMRCLFILLENLTGIRHLRHENPDYKGWRRWVNQHTPPDKRGGP